MNIVICIKAVSSKLVYSNEQREERLTLNPYDLLALEYLIKLKAEYDYKITCLCMGASDAKSVLIHCLAMGADEAILLSDKKFAGADTYATTFTLHKALQNIDYDLIVCGGQAVDGETGQVSFGLAQRLNIPCIAEVIDIHSFNKEGITIQTRDIEFINDIYVQFPAMISFRDFQTESGKISLLALKRAQKKQIPIWNLHDLGIDCSNCGQAGSKTIVLNASSALDKKNIHFLKDTTKENIQFMIEKIKLYSPE